MSFLCEMPATFEFCAHAIVPFKLLLKAFVVYVSFYAHLMHRLITIISQAERNDMEASSLSKKCIELMDNSTSFTLFLFSMHAVLMVMPLLKSL